MEIFTAILLWLVTTLLGFDWAGALGGLGQLFQGG